MTSTNQTVLTAGHSTLSYEDFLELLRGAEVTAVADVRSAPYSRQQPQFNRERLKEELRRDGIEYVFLGKELGGRPAGDQFFCEGIADYQKMAEAPEFKEGIRRVREGSTKYRICLVCSERDPLDCHRCLLVGRALLESGVPVRHIMPTGDQVSQEVIEEQLLSLSRRSTDDLFAPREQRLVMAYRERARKVAFAKPGSILPPSAAAE